MFAAVLETLMLAAPGRTQCFIQILFEILLLCTVYYPEVIFIYRNYIVFDVKSWPDFLSKP